MSKIIIEKTCAHLRIVLGICFILSGTMKAVSINSFVQEVRLYIEAYIDSHFLQWAAEIAIAVCTIEITTGLLAFRKEFASLVSVSFLAMMSFFVWLTGMNLFSPSLMGSIESCGCFGELVHFTPLTSFIKSIILWLMAIVLCGLYWKSNGGCRKSVKE